MDRNGEASSVSQQEDAARDLIDQRCCTLVGVYVDNSITGTGKKHRPEFYAMLAAVQRGEIDAIVARHMDRIARNARERLLLVEACREHGVIIALVQGSDMDPTTASGRMIIDVLGSVAEMEVAIKSERHVAALQRHALAGKVPHGPRPLGYSTIGKIVRSEAKIVTDIFTRFYAGESLRSLVRLLDDTKVPTRSGRPWNTRTVRDILTNPRYAGWAVYRGEIATDNDGNRVRGQWKQLVSEEVFDVIAARLADPARKSNRVGTDRRYLGSGLYLCAARLDSGEECDRPVQTVNGGKYFCAGHLTREHRHVDAFVLDVIAERLAAKDFEKLLAPDEAHTKPITDKAKTLRARLVKIDNEYDDGIIDGPRWRSAKQKVQAELTTLDAQLATLRGGAALGAVVAAPDPTQAFREASLMAQRVVIDALCTVRLRRQPRGRLKRNREGREVIDPATVDITWKR